MFILKLFTRKAISLFFLMILYSLTLFSHQELTSDELFVLAKKQAYQENNYPLAINTIKKALTKSPNYADLRIFLGRLYTFTNQLDSAKTEFSTVLSSEKNNADAINGLFDLSYWNNNYNDAISASEMGIKFYPDSTKYYIQKAKSLNAMLKLDEAIEFAQQSSSKFKNSAELRNLLNELNYIKEDRNNPSSDSLFIVAKKEAYTNNNYPLAIATIKKSIAKSPTYKDLQVFLGRLYTFSDKPDSARQVFQNILNSDLKNTDAIDGIFDIEYWGNNYTQAQNIADLGINNYPDTALYYVKKAKVLDALEKPYEALELLENNYDIIQRDSSALEYYRTLKVDNLKNRIGVSYEYVYFDKRFDQPWHFGAISYGYRSKFGRIITRLNYANRFDSQGLQGEIESYPSLKNIGYQYIGFGVSDSPIFPKIRAGYSLFASLPKSFEAEVGIRYLRFTENTFLYTLAIGRYVGNNFYNLRSFISPDNPAWSYSFTASARFFMSDDMDNFFGLSAGTGVSPDDRTREIFINSFANLKSYKAGISYNKVVKKKDLFSIDFGWFIEEYNTDTWGNQYNIGFSYSRRF